MASKQFPNILAGASFPSDVQLCGYENFVQPSKVHIITTVNRQATGFFLFLSLVCSCRRENSVHVLVGSFFVP